jgi:hypothetical protein
VREANALAAQVNQLACSLTPIALPIAIMAIWRATSVSQDLFG